MADLSHPLSEMSHSFVCSHPILRPIRLIDFFIKVSGVKCSDVLEKPVTQTQTEGHQSRPARVS